MTNTTDHQIKVEIRMHYPTRRAKYFYVYRYPEDSDWTASLIDHPTMSAVRLSARKRFPQAEINEA